jgi:hypothetical protein
MSAIAGAGIRAGAPSIRVRSQVHLATRGSSSAENVGEAAVVIDVQMRQDDVLHISRADAERAQLGTDFLLALESKRHLPSMIRVQRSGGVEDTRPVAGVGDDHSIGMVDDPGIGRKPRRPVSVGQDAQPPSQPASPATDLCRLDSNRPGLESEDLHAFATTDRTACG